jgi:hypothetical protein
VGERAHVEAPRDAQPDGPGPQAKQTKILTLFVELESIGDLMCETQYTPPPDITLSGNLKVKWVMTDWYRPYRYLD